MDFTILKTAGITQGEFAWLCGVSRVTVNNWVKRGSVHTLVAPKVKKILNAVTTAQAQGALPAPDADRVSIEKYGLVNRKLGEIVKRHLA